MKKKNAGLRFFLPLRGDNDYRTDGITNPESGGGPKPKGAWRMKAPFRIGDLLVYVFILLLTAGSFAGLYRMGVGKDVRRVTVEVGGKLIATYDLPKGNKEREVRVDAGNGCYNLLKLTSSGVSVEEANCPDQVCVKWGRISKPGQSIVCLPHKVVISIVGNREGEPLDGIAS